MKKLMIGVLSLAFASCMTAAVSLHTDNASAQETQNTSIFTETKCQISKSGDKMLMVTGITDVSKVYEVGYDISGGYELTPSDVAETNKYYESLTLGSVTKTASEFIAGAQGLLIWEVGYNSAYTYTVQPYAYLGELNASGQLIAPEVETKSYGAVKASFNQVTVTFAEEDGTVVATQNVNIGAKATAITAPEKADAEFDGWYVNGTEYNFDQKVSGNITITAKYKKAVNYTVKIETAEYAQGYTSPWYCPGALSYVDSTSDYASYLGVNANGINSAMSGTTIDLTEAVKNLPAGVKVSNESVLTGVVEEDGSLELNVKLDFDEDYLGFKLSQIKLGEYSCNNLKFKLANVNGVIGLSIKGNIGNGKALYIDIDDVDRATTSSLVFGYYEKAATLDNSFSRLSVTDGAGTWTSDGDKTSNILTNTPNVDCYYGADIEILERFPSVSKIAEVRVKYAGPFDRDILITGLKTQSNAFKKNAVWNLDNEKLANKVQPLAIGTISQEKHSFGASGDMNAIVYNHAEKEPGNEYLSVGVKLDLGGVIDVNNYDSIKVLFQTTAQKTDNTGYNPGTLIYINGVNVTPGNGYQGTYYGGVHTADLIALAKAMGIGTIKTVNLIHARWGSIYNINMYIGSIDFKLAAGVAEDKDPSLVAKSVTYNADNNNIQSIAKVLNQGTTSTESYYFGNNAEGIAFSQNAFYYNYEGESVTGMHQTGVVFDLGEINLADYKSVKVAFQTVVNNGGTNVMIDGIEVASLYGGAHIVDLKTLGEAKGLTSFSKLELSISSWANVTSCKMYVAYIELIANN